jgi:hypothetical protein
VKLRAKANKRKGGMRKAFLFVVDWNYKTEKKRSGEASA